MKRCLAPAALVALALSASGAEAAKIIAPVSVTANTGTAGSPLWVPRHMIDQSGLSQTYVAGVTEFDDFLAANPVHTYAPGTPWLSTGNVTTSVLTFDFGRIVSLGAFAIFDDPRTTISSLRFSTPDGGRRGAFVVADHDLQPAPAQVFQFRPFETRYLTVEIAGCNGPSSGSSRWNGCGIGEFVFADGTAGAVPEPATWAMMILGFGGVGALLRRRAAPLAA